MAQEVLRTMLWHQLKATVLSLLLLATLATGAGYLSRSLATAQDKPRPAPAAKPSTIAAKPDHSLRPAHGRMIVVGRVLDPHGRPATGVPVDIIGASRTPPADTDVDRAAFVVLGQGAADGDGRFRIEASRASSTRFFHVYALAGAAGRGSAFGCVKLHPDAEQPVAEVHLQPEQVIRGKLVDVSGQPAAGVAVQLGSVYGEDPRVDGSPFDSPRPILVFDGAVARGGLRAWPKAVATDAQGRFTFTGVGRGLHVFLYVRDPRFAQQRFHFQAGDRDAAKEVSLALYPPTIIEGRVLAADTGQPIPDAGLTVSGGFGGLTGGMSTRFRADGQGRFKINPCAGDDFLVHVLPPEGQPYLPLETELKWPKGAVKKEIDLTLPRGVLIRGKATEQGTGRPVARASVQFFPMKPPRDLVYGIDTNVATGEDGSFQLTVPPGKGYLTVVGPTLDYIPQEIGGGQLYGGGQPGGHRIYAHAIIAYDVKAGEGPRELNPILKPGKTVRGRLVGPDGETVEDAVILSRQQIHPTNLSWQEYHFIHAHDGRFELAGFDPDKAVPVYFLDADHGWGARVELSGRQAGEELTIRLQPCGQARARFVGPDGKPVAKLKVWLYFQILMIPGSRRLGSLDRGEPMAADGAFLPNVDPKHHPIELATDPDGRVTLPALIPAAPYRISDWSTVNVQGKGYQIRKDFTVKPGETLDLGDILVEKPSN
jgi:protocatechuate 3,4-dioxygenase beta subunit